MKRIRTKLMAGTGAALVVVGGGAAYAASEGTPKQESRAVIEDAAKELGVDSQAFADALEQALGNRVDEAVADGRLTQAQGEALKARIGSGDVPLFGLRGGRHGHRHGGALALDAAAPYLGLTQAELRWRLRGGTSLADVAQVEGKPVDGLVAALVAAAKTRLAGAVAAGRLTAEQRDALLETLEARIAGRVEATGFRQRAFPQRGFGAPHPGPPAAA